MVDLRFSDVELTERREHITAFIEETVADAAADGAVLGLSGGIDSTTVAHLAVEALGTGGLKGLVMPGEVSREDNMSDAERVAEMLDIEYEVIEIQPIIEQFVAGYPDAEGDDLAVGNARARTRGVLNYLVGNHENRLVLGTGNRSEAQVGYYTKYGDQAVDCNPIGNLYKVQVRQLARELGVPDDLVEKTPTAGLWSEQTDEDEMGIAYDTLDPILALHIGGPLSASATAATLDVDLDTVERVREMYERSAHKRSMPPAPPALD
ncbi:NAD+ synthase [Natranaeroarchaeum aerophilus]|uniref:NH(3)-dependent NAD(+) synthetase n=1 Tax=Natranaeroarchaeum aerophilus TaxID=2917711 RepID=A0AAE3K5X7_9EURY|nr:NAD+ synthase [Natranaeroarchaeum aerophilus]MCL9812189.1 NAD+ synthase [Natranaeroarchaeum aerophilus]